MLAVANRLKCEVHFATSALTKPSFQPLKILYIQQDKLKTAQRNWLKYRDGMAKVSSFTSANRGGSMESIDVLYNQVLIVRAQALLIAPPSLE